jgi:hypothetical protein
MSLDVVTAIIASLGLGGLVGTILQSFMSNRNKVFEDAFSKKAERYKAIMILMWTSLDPKSELRHLKFFRSDIQNTETLRRELKLELYNMMLYAGDNVMRSFKQFVKKPNHKNYAKVALEMRKDLYGKRTNIDFDEIKIEL